MGRKLYFTKYNYIIFSIGLVTLALGFYLMTIGPHDSFWSLTFAPILIMFSLAVIFPYSIMKSFRK